MLAPVVLEDALAVVCVKSFLMKVFGSFFFFLGKVMKNVLPFFCFLPSLLFLFEKKIQLFLSYRVHASYSSPTLGLAGSYFLDGVSKTSLTSRKAATAASAESASDAAGDSWASCRERASGRTAARAARTAALADSAAAATEATTEAAAAAAGAAAAVVEQRRRDCWERKRERASERVSLRWRTHSLAADVATNKKEPSKVFFVQVSDYALYAFNPMPLDRASRI